MINIGTILRPIGKRYAIRVTKCYPEGKTIRIVGQHLTQDLKPTNSSFMAINVVKDGDCWQQVDNQGVVSYHGFSRYEEVQRLVQMELFNA